MSEQMTAITFDNLFTRELPADSDTSNRQRQVTGAAYSRVEPQNVAAPALLSYSPEVAAILDFPESFCRSEEFVQVFSGNRLLPGMDPYAACYGGHQFGNWAGQLGDGRAINLGEIVNHLGERWTLQLKGAGPTPYSRMADGLAVVRSSVREYLCSEAMYHLGVPTTRALSLVTTGENVIRDMFYDGNPKAEPGAIVCRVAPTFTRLGNFEIFAARREHDLLRQMVDFTITHDFPHLGVPSRDTYVAWLREVCQLNLTMIVHWMRVGFVHGVMNTDNMSVAGLTIDYGPYGWLEDFDPNWTPNTTDASGRRYRFGHQPQIALWNLVRFANSIYPVIEEIEPLQEVMDEAVTFYEQQWQEMMAQKLGLDRFQAEKDLELVNDLQTLLQLAETDMTIFYRNLATVTADAHADETMSDDERIAPLMDAYYAPDDVTPEIVTRTAAWLRRYIDRVRDDGTPDAVRRDRMNRVNPKYVLRNYIAQLAIDKAEQGDASLINELLDLLRRPYDEQPSRQQYAAKRPEWARHRAGCSMLSCSS